MPEAAAAAPAAEPMEEEAGVSCSTTEESAASPSEEVGLSSMEEVDEEENGSEPTGTLWCSGDAPDTPQQHNFEGVWRLHKLPAASTTQLRPVYEHNAPGGTAVYLYFVEQTLACPRWVIGPEPAGNGMNGWAYSDSSAMRPEDIIEPWHSWVKETSEWGEARLAFSAKGSALGSEVDIGDDEAVMASGELSEGATGGGAPKKKKAKKKAAASKGGTAAKAKKGDGDAATKKKAKPKPAAK